MPDRTIILGDAERKSREELKGFDEWALAEDTTAGLAQVLLNAPRNYEVPEEAVGRIHNLHANRLIGIRMFRAIRAGMAVLSIGYEPEGRALDRVLVELLAHRKAILDDPSGDEAQAWLNGKRDRGITAKVNAMQPKDLYKNLNYDAHGDPRALRDLYRPDSDTYLIGPQRRPLAARATLLMYAGTLCDQIRVLATLGQFALDGLENLDTRVRDGWDRLERDATEAESGTAAA